MVDLPLLANACIKLDVTAVREAMQQGTDDLCIEFDDPQYHASGKTTPLAYAARNNQVDIVSELLSSDNCDINQPSGDAGTTALHEAAYHGHVSVVNLLLSHPACNPNSREISHGDSPLHEAALSGKADVIDALLEDDRIDVNAVDDRGRTPLFIAIYWGHIDVVLRLLAHESCVTILRGPDGLSCLYWAGMKGNVAMVNLLLDHQRVGTLDAVVVMYWAPSDVVAACLEHGCHPDTMCHYSHNPLHHAVKHNLHDKIAVLLSHGANPHLINSDAVSGRRTHRLILAQLLNHWIDGVPSLYDQCVWKVKRMRSRLDEEYMVDCVLPDAMVWDHFSHWNGAAKWCLPWLPAAIEDSKAELQAAKEANGDGDGDGDGDREFLLSKATKEVERLEAMLVTAILSKS